MPDGDKQNVIEIVVFIHSCDGYLTLAFAVSRDTIGGKW